MEYTKYKHRLEREYGISMEAIMREIYIEKQHGPATGAKALGIPRQAFMHFVHEYNLKQDKIKQI